ncbi:hypothetical protein [Desulfotignum balticum]|uniref:hypothetical protein n=1 Tax=Desulfotignum balticum TaxID=115781 RepID=UPI000462E0A2|nr:hypothetical protein [Desulfotignum balticum]
MEYILNNILPGVVVAFITSIVTVKLSINKFRSERWWERKADTYSKIVTSIHQLLACCEDHVEYIESGMEDDSNAEKRFQNAILAATGQMDKTLEAGSFFISSDSEKVIKNLKMNLEKAKDQSGFDEYFTYIFESLKEGLSEIQRLAKKDLKIT